MTKPQCELGMIGLGVMGRNLLLNMADHGFSVAGYDRDAQKVEALRGKASGRPVHAADDLPGLLRALRTPRAVMMLVPAGPPVDAVIRELLPHLKPGDLVIDGGNSHFTDTALRASMLAAKKIDFLGVGISGGESGARHGPSIMPGGAPKAYERVRLLFEAVAAHVEGEPCVAWLGPEAAGHYVKMVHNGIEYGLMQLIAETYDLMKRGLDLSDDQLHAVYEQWNRTELAGYLVEIAAEIFLRVDEKTGYRLIDVILDAAKQKGTGMWTSQDALELQAPTPVIDIAVAMRNLSALDDERTSASRLLRGPSASFAGKSESFVEMLRNAYYAASIVVFAQGMAQLRAASRAHGWDLNLSEIARIWRGGCIIRAALLEPIRAAFAARPDLANLLVDPALGQAVVDRQQDLRDVVAAATELGIPAPALSVSLAYYDAYRSEWLPANLVQAQRDYFGAHTYERVDAKGVFHTQWERPGSGRQAPGSA